jgi:predicted MFS family arabinose efflux permease
MAKTFAVTSGRIGSIAMLTQIGVAAGMLFFVPLGDKFERRSLITAMLAAACVSLCGAAMAPSLLWLGVASLAVGATASAMHVLVPFAAHLAPENSRGKIIGTVLSGLLMGILLARTFSGFLGSLFGWRSVFWTAAIFMLVLAVVLHARLPRNLPEQTLSWLELMRSIFGLVRKHADLRESAFIGATLFCAFSVFWTTLVFFLQIPPYHYGPSVAGAFGLIGAAGAACAPLVGQLVDRHGPRRTVFVAIGVSIVAFLILGRFGTTLPGLILGVALLDLGVQSGHVSNQARIYAIDPAARSRLNTVYMFCCFAGGAVGSSVGPVLLARSGWQAVCGFATAVLASSPAIRLCSSQKSCHRS